MGDFNGRVGKRRPPWERYLGPFSFTPTECNEHGLRLLNLLSEYNLYITNTFFQHRESQIKTWYRWNNLDQASQIDYIIVRQLQKRLISDSKAIPNSDIDTDHRPIVLSIHTPKNGTKNIKRTESIINLGKLQETVNKNKFQEDITTAFSGMTVSTSHVEEEWTLFKSIT